MSAHPYRLSPELDRMVGMWQRRAMLAALALGLAGTIGAFLSIVPFLESYLMAYLLWLGVSLGSLALIMLQFLTGGQWGVVTRGLLESAARTLPLMALLFLPVLIGAGWLYPWAFPGATLDPLIAKKAAYLNLPFFWIRAVLYFAIWIGFLYLVLRVAARMPNPRARGAVQAISGVGTIVYVFTLTFASVDWMQSLNPHWYSTIWGFLFVVGQGLSALSFLICATLLVARRPPLSEVLTARHRHDLGKLLLAFVMLWAYMEFSQLLIIWAGNLPEEIPWFISRIRENWMPLTGAIFLLQFLVPFLLLLSRRLKRQERTLFVIAALLLLMRQVDLFWKVVPWFHPPVLHWLHVVVPVAFACLWMTAFLFQLRRASLLPVGDPRLEEVLAHGNE